MKYIRPLLALFLLFALVFASLLVFRWLLTEETTDMRRGSLRYAIEITEPVVSEFPMPGRTDEPLFTVYTGDGNAPAYQQVTFTTRAPVSDVFAHAERHARANGFARETVDATLAVFQRSSESLEVAATPLSHGTAHTIVVTLYFF